MIHHNIVAPGDIIRAALRDLVLGDGVKTLRDGTDFLPGLTRDDHVWGKVVAASGASSEFGLQPFRLDFGRGFHEDVIYRVRSSAPVEIFGSIGDAADPSMPPADNLSEVAFFLPRESIRMPLVIHGVVQPAEIGESDGSTRRITIPVGTFPAPNDDLAAIGGVPSELIFHIAQKTRKLLKVGSCVKIRHGILAGHVGRVVRIFSERVEVEFEDDVNPDICRTFIVGDLENASEIDMDTGTFVFSGEVSDVLEIIV